MRSDGDVTVRVMLRARVHFHSISVVDGMPQGSATVLPDVELGVPPACLTTAAHAAARVWRCADVHHVAQQAWQLARSSGIVTASHEEAAMLAWTRATADATVALPGHAHDAAAVTSASHAPTQAHPSVIHTVEDDAAAASRAAFRPRCAWQAMCQDATGFSWWLARNLPLSSTKKQCLLQEHSTLKRLQREVALMQRAAIMSCASCGQDVTQYSSILAMSGTGVMTVFVNPHGVVSRVLTTHAVCPAAVDVRSLPELADTWYPGYGWSIVDCARCSNHLGWRYDWLSIGGDVPREIEWDAAREEFMVTFDDDYEMEVHSDDAASDDTGADATETPVIADAGAPAPATAISPPPPGNIRGVMRHLMALLQSANVAGGELGIGLERFAGLTPAAAVRRRPLSEIVTEPPPAEQPRVFYGLRQGAVVPRYAAGSAPSDE